MLPALLLSAFASAQKLPNIQKEGLRAPANIKIDGKATEWNNKLQAYNHAIQARYTLSNDDHKLYLTVSSNRREIINKMIHGGVSLTINKIKRSINGAAVVTYPSFNVLDPPVMGLNAMFNIKPGTPDADREIDSLINADNSVLNSKAKFIRLSGLHDDVDTLISVYNKDGIKANCAFDNNRTFTIEISVNLKLLGLSIEDQSPFNYNIRFNETKIDYVPGVAISRNPDGTITQMVVNDAKLANSYISALNTTDCWGQYTLVK